MKQCRLVHVWVWLLLTGTVWSQEPETAPPGTVVETIKQEVNRVRPLIKGESTRAWLEQANNLKPITPFTLRYQDKDLQVDEARFYLGRYGSPIAYARILDLLEGHGLDLKAGTKVLDFGYGSMGQLQMLSQMGLVTAGVDVDPLLPLIYEGHSGELGEMKPALFNGRFPAEVDLVNRIGDGYDLFLSKNTLKRGYVHPSRQPSNPRQLIDLGVKDDEFLAAINRLLKPGGYFAIYNFCPAKAAADKPYIPWAEGECPFSRIQLESAGFEVVAFDAVDDRSARELAHELGWDNSGGMNLENDLFAWYTIAKKKNLAHPPN